MCYKLRLEKHFKAQSEWTGFIPGERWCEKDKTDCELQNNS